MLTIRQSADNPSLYTVKLEISGVSMQGVLDTNASIDIDTTDFRLDVYFQDENKDK